MKTGTMQFNSSGDLTAPTGAVPGIAVAGLADGASNMTLEPGTWREATDRRR